MLRHSVLLQLCFLLFTLIPVRAFSQLPDTVFFNEDWERTDRRMDDGFYGFKEKDSANFGLATYYYGTGELHSYQYEKDDLKHGPCIWFYKSGHLYSRGRYRNDHPAGHQEFYDEEELVEVEHVRPSLSDFYFDEIEKYPEDEFEEESREYAPGSPEELIVQSWVDYRIALLSKNGDQVANHLSEHMMDYYKTMLYRARYYERRELEALPIMDLLGVMLVRHHIKKKQLISFDERQLLLFAVEKEMFDANGVNFEFSHIEVEGSDAQAFIPIPGSEESIVLDFHLEEGLWKIDLGNLLDMMNVLMEDILKQSGIPRAEFAELALTKYLHKAPSPKLWDAPLKK